MYDYNFTVQLSNIKKSTKFLLILSEKNTVNTSHILMEICSTSIVLKYQYELYSY